MIVELSRFVARGLNGIAAGIVEENLSSANARDDVVYATIKHYSAHQTLPARSRQHGDNSGE